MILAFCKLNLKLFFSPQELYQKLTDFDIRFYMYELLKVSLAVLPCVFSYALPVLPSHLPRISLWCLGHYFAASDMICVFVFSGSGLLSQYGYYAP